MFVFMPLAVLRWLFAGQTLVSDVSEIVVVTH